MPAWYGARAQTVAEWRGFEKIAALQLEYSLLERNIEREHVPMALELGSHGQPSRRMLEMLEQGARASGVSLQALAMLVDSTLLANANVTRD